MGLFRSIYSTWWDHIAIDGCSWNRVFTTSTVRPCVVYGSLGKQGCNLGSPRIRNQSLIWIVLFFCLWVESQVYDPNAAATLGFPVVGFQQIIHLENDLFNILGGPHFSHRWFMELATGGAGTDNRWNFLNCMAALLKAQPNLWDVKDTNLFVTDSVPLWKNSPISSQN